ncbi:MAG: hypothetical protein K8U57_39615 [Planctomycetes bacterium]|nr:hypothetical protein [Planctomycetota bacterium]
MRSSFAIVAALSLPAFAFAGHTRPGYVDGCQSPDGRFVVTAESKKDPKGKDGWEFTWKDTKTNTTHTGWLVGLPYGLEHFRVTYTHIFVPPGGETFAVFQTASWASGGSKPPGGQEKQVNQNPSDEFKSYAGFADRIVVYKKTGEVVRRLSMNDILKPNEWVYVNSVQGNLYWLSEYPDVMKGGEPPRCGYRYYRISPDYTVLEFTVGPNSDALHKVKDEGADVVNYRRVVQISLTDGTFLDKKPTDKDKIPVRPFVGELVKRGDDMKNYVPSLDPVRVAGKVGPASK